MSVKLGNSTVKAMYIGNDNVKSIYLGSTLVWGSTAPVEQDSISTGGTTAMSFTSTGNVSHTVTITSNKDWTASASHSWIHVPSSGVNGAVVSVRCDENTSTGSRAGSITFTSGTATATISVSQSGVEAYITINPEEINVGTSSTRISVDVSCNTHWTCSSSNESWITIVDPDAQEGDYAGFEISIGANSGSQRDGYVYFNTDEGEDSCTLTIHQSGVSVQPRVVPAGRNWYNDSNSEFVDKQTWNVAFIGGSTGKTWNNVTAYILDGDNSNTIQVLVQPQNVTVSANETKYWGLSAEKLEQKDEYQLEYDGNIVDTNPYRIIVQGDNVVEEAEFTKARF